MLSMLQSSQNRKAKVGTFWSLLLRRTVGFCLRTATFRKTEMMEKILEDAAGMVLTRRRAFHRLLQRGRIQQRLVVEDACAVSSQPS